MYLKSFIILCGACSLFFCTASLIYHPTRLHYSDPRLFRLSYKEQFFFGVDKNLIHSWYFPSLAKKPKATIIQFHGNSQNLTAQYLNLIWLVREGYNLFTFDYRGYGQSEGSPNTKKIIADTILLVKELQEQNQKKKTPLILYGQSLGSIIVIHTFIGLKENKYIAGIVLEGGFDSFQNLGRKIINQAVSPPFGLLSYVFLSDYHATTNLIAKLSPLPILIIHGKHDMIVPISFGKKLYSLSHSPRDLLIVPNGKHLINWLEKKNQFEKDQLLMKLRQILDQYKSS